MKWIFFCIVLTLVGCRTQREYINHEVHDTVYVSKVQYDSIYFKDSVVYYGDTVYMVHWREKYKTLYDTVQKSVVEYRDSIVNRDIVKYEVSKYDRFCRTWMWISIAIIVIMIAWWVVKKYVLKI